jgi:hypothetical protein
MRYMKQEDADRVGACNFPNIHATGSVRGMQMRYGWPRGGQVRVGSWIYNVGPANVKGWKSQGLVRG